MHKSKTLVFLFLMSFLICCKIEPESESFVGEFNGYWAETIWNYKFFPDHKFLTKMTFALHYLIEVQRWSLFQVGLLLSLQTLGGPEIIS